MPYEACLNTTTFETAVVSENYPFGYRLKCLKKQWIETAQKSAQRGRSRIMAATTTKPFNAEYTKLIIEQNLRLYAAGLDNNEEVMRLREAAGASVCWNKPKASVYRFGLIVLYKKQVEGRGNEKDTFIKSAEISMGYCGPQEFYIFEYLIGDEQLDEQQLKMRQLMEKHSRRTYPEEWAKWEALDVAAKTTLMGPRLSRLDSEERPE